MAKIENTNFIGKNLVSYEALAILQRMIQAAGYTSPSVYDWAGERNVFAFSNEFYGQALYGHALCVAGYNAITGWAYIQQS